MNPHDQNLINNYINDDITDEQFAELQMLLRESAEARLLLRNHAMVAAKFEQLAAMNPNTMALLDQDSSELVFPVARNTSSSWFKWPSLVAAAAGLIIGIGSQTLVFGYVMNWGTKAITLLQEGFENNPTVETTGMPHVVDVWSGDYTAITTKKEVTPTDGTHMLQFLRADYTGKKPGDQVSYISATSRLLDLRPQKNDLADGNSIIQLSGLFNANSYPDHERYVGSVIIFALDAKYALSKSYVSEDNLMPNALAVTKNQFMELDRDPQTWQRMSAELRLPPNTEYVMIQFQMSHNTKRQRRETFDGHYLDKVRVSLIRRPLALE